MIDRDIARMMRLENRIRESIAVCSTSEPWVDSVYFIGGDDTPIKIGFSSAPTLRLEALQTGHWVKLSILATSPGTLATEAEYHNRFAEHRLHGEWFARSPTLLAEIARLNEGGVA